MYLLKSNTLELEFFNDESCLPSYAILSHTWGQGEVTFEQIKTMKGDPFGDETRKIQKGPGYWKIKMACEQATKDGLKYAWVDTCCIDKKSSAELSEAINSMFRWYRMADVCYVYLSDIVSKRPGKGQKRFSKGRALANVKESTWIGARWFTRGWTLQELIAPTHVEFFVQDWKYLGTKLSLRDGITTVTGINGNALFGEDLELFSVAERMTWARSRVTTRPEDMAYSLLGIFNVNMPLLYGEGDKAFVRLQEEIMKDNNDQSLFSWAPANAIFAERGARIFMMARPQWRSVFASHPREYVPSKPLFIRSAETFALTNRGVKIRVAALPFHRQLLDASWGSLDPHEARDSLSRVLKQSPLLLVVLNCSFKFGDFGLCRVGVVCQAIDETGEQLVRHDSAALWPVTNESVKQARWLDVYMLKKLPSA